MLPRVNRNRAVDVAVYAFRNDLSSPSPTCLFQSARSTILELVEDQRWRRRYFGDRHILYTARIRRALIALQEVPTTLRERSRIKKHLAAIQEISPYERTDTRDWRRLYRLRADVIYTWKLMKKRMIFWSM
jgi:hypothetical protein